MEDKEGINNKDILEEKDLFKQAEIIIKLISKFNIKNTQEFFKKDKKLLSAIIQYINKIISLYLKETEKINTTISNKKYIINIIKKRRVNFIINLFKNTKEINNNMKYKQFFIKDKKVISCIFIIICFCLFFKVITLKKQNKNKKLIILIYKCMNALFCILGKLFLEEIIEIEYFELLIKILLTFVIKDSLISLDEEINKNNEIYNLIFFKSAIILIKNTFEKILLFKKKFTDRQNELINNLIIFIHGNIIYSDIETKRIKYINKYFLSKYDCNTIQLLDLYKVILHTNSENIINNYLELISDIYAFDFKYNNLMNPLLKQLQPLFINLTNKDLVKINDELISSNFSLSLVKSLIKKENQIITEEEYRIKEGFYLRGSKCGIIANLKTLDADCSIIFSFKIDKENKEDIILLSLNTEKQTLKFFLRQKMDKNYEMIFEERNNTTELLININIDLNYIFVITFSSEKMFKTTIKTRYIKDKEKKFYNGRAVSIKNFKKENMKLYFGCHLNLQTNEIENKFKGFIGDIIIFNSKNNKSSNSTNNFEDDFIIGLKGNYKDLYNILLEKDNQEKYIFINKKRNLETERKINNKDIQKIITAENFKLIISPEYFKLLNYYDDIDYMNIYHNIFDEKITDNYFIKRKYLDLKLKTETGDEDKTIIITSNYFDKNFHIFKKEFTINEFIKYDGIHLLSLIMEYYFQILNNIYEKKLLKETQEIKDLCKKVEKNIFENLIFFNENILQKINLLNINLADINKYFYQISNTILKYIEIEEINFDLIEYLIKISETIKSEENEDFINDIKIKIIEFVFNPYLFRKEEVNIESLKSTLNNVLKIMKENVKNDIFTQKLKTEQFINQIFLLLWIFDDYNIKDKENIKMEDLKESSRKLYTELLRISFQALIIKKEGENEYQLIEESESKKNKIIKEKSKEDLEKDNEKNKQKKIIEIIFDKLYEYRDNTNIFCAFLNIIKDSNLIKNVDKSKIIETLKKIIRIKNREEKNSKNKILNSCIILLVQIYLVDNNDEDLKEIDFHIFIRKLGINLDIIYSLLSSINILIADQNEKGKDIQSKTDPYDEILLNINLKDLDQNNINIIHAIKTIFEDIVYLLCSNWDKNEQNYSKETLEVLQKNIDLIFNFAKESQSIYLNDFFSSESLICAEFFYFQLKNIKGEIMFLEKLIKTYDVLLKIYPCPFYFKFYYLLFKEVSEGSIENNDKNKIYLLQGILNSLNDFINNNEKFENIIINLLNFAIILNLEYEKKFNSLFEKSAFQKLFYKFFSLVEKTGVLYSNYYIELNANQGKIISEIIFDIHICISNITLDKYKFASSLIKSNEKAEDNFTIFYFIDICKEKGLEKDKKTTEELRRFIPNYEKIIEIKNYLKNNKLKLFQGRHLIKIEHVNITMYFLAKSFVYFKKGNLNQEFRQFLNESFFSLLSEDIFNLYTQKSKYYGNELCKSFPLYYYVKTFVETNIIPDKSFNNFEDYINNEMPMELKDEYNLQCCYSSRLSKNKRAVKKRISISEKTINDIKEEIESEKGNSNSRRQSLIATTYIFRVSSKSVNLSGSNELEWSFKSNNESKLSSEKDDDSSLHSFINTEKMNVNPFIEFQKDRNIIFCGKKLFLKKVFSESFKNLLFYDKSFMKVKLAFLLNFRQYKNIDEGTKQFNYPITQKNYSNSIEPKIFMKKDSNFYDKFYLKLSHKYLNDSVFKNVENLDFYHHVFKFDEKVEKNKVLFCEIVTLKYISLGKMYFFDDYIIFKTELEDPRDNNKDMETFFKFGISNKNKDFPSKQKFIILYSKFIEEIIQRRTLLVNNSVEIFMKNGKSYFFNFFRKNNVEKAYNYLSELAYNLEKKKYKKFSFCINSNEEEIKKLISSFKKGKISNYEYILKLNKYSTRTYNDTSQYPVFPWLLKKYDNIQDILKMLSNKEGINQKELLPFLRDMNYPNSLQSEKKRQEAINNFNKDIEEQEKLDEEEKFPTHWINHYSTSAYIYYFLMRLNPYLKSFIKLQGENLEDPNRTFNNFSDTETILDFHNDNRELIPDFFCYFDFLLNSNCNLFGVYNNDYLIDDFIYFKIDSSEYKNRISSFAVALLNNNKILNNYHISKIINNWVDIIFGTRQLPKNDRDLLESCNIYKRVSYEQETNLEKIIEPFEKTISLNQKNEKEEKSFKKKIEPLIVNMINFGVCPKKILDENVVYDGKIRTYDSIFKNYKFSEDKLIYFNYINDSNAILIKDIKKNKTKIREAIIIENKNLKEKEGIIYNFKSMNLMKEKNGLKNVQLYQYRYAFSLLTLQCQKTKIFIMLSCRYFENYFRIQCQDKILNIFYEDFITSIKGRNLFEFDNIFYTGLINGKLTEWEIVPSLDINIKNKKKALKCIYNFEIKERKHVYAHNSSISVIEIYQKQKIVITAGEDKYIYIRKTFDFELLTAIDLTYSFGNPIISQNLNIFPSMIKVSDLNLLFVMIYDYNSKNNFIRGYNLNGLFFAQTDKKLFEENILFNNFSFTRDSNLVVGSYNSNNFYVLNAGILSPIWIKELEEKEEGKKEKKNKKKIQQDSGNKLVEFNCDTGEFYVLKEHEIIFTSINDKFKLKEFENF